MARTKKVDNVEVSKVNTENTENTETNTKQKRGRKPKKDINESKKQELSEKIVEKQNNIECVIEEKNPIFLPNNNCIYEIINDSTISQLNNNIKSSLTDDIELDKSNDTNKDILENNNDANTNENINEDSIQKTGIKKRGRKPKGGKIIQQIISINNNKEIKPNVILHLKCSLKDLQNNTLLSSNIESFNFSNNNNINNLSYELISSNEPTFGLNNFRDIDNDNDNLSIKNKDDNYENDYDNESAKDCEIKEIWKKLKLLEHNLHINNISDKKSACFFDTCEFDNPPVYIPKHFINGTYEVYGCFCCPECAVGYLMNEPIDSSIKFERYHLMNFIYGKIYNYTKNIKPATSPYYMLDKYYGNLTIQQYRSLLRYERLFLIVDKPLTRILPELHEDNDDFIINNKIIPSNTYQIKKKIQRKNQSKNNILNEKFGLNQQ